MFLVVIEKVADTPWMIVVICLVQAACFQYLNYLRGQMPGELPPPDYRFGYTYEDLNDWYDSIGVEGCNIYKKHAMVDLFPYMQTYALIGGAFLLQQLRPMKWNPKIALIFPMAMVMDMIETGIPVYGCNLLQYQGGKRLSRELVEAASAANQLKWTQFSLGMFLLSTLFVYHSVRVPSSGGSEESSKEKKKDD